mgnify:CR=1 FL=1
MSSSFSERRKTDFVAELAFLLERYDATILVGCSEFSDLYGVFDENITIEIESEKIEFRLADGWGVSAYDLRKNWRIE